MLPINSQFFSARALSKRNHLTYSQLESFSSDQEYAVERVGDNSRDGRVPSQANQRSFEPLGHSCHAKHTPREVDRQLAQSLLYGFGHARQMVGSLVEDPVG